VVQGWRGEGREVVAYAWEFGSHGGVAPEELEAFVAHPAQCAFRFADAIRPSELHAFFERVRAGAGRRPRGAAASGAPRAARGEAALRPEGPAEGGGRGIPAP
jgi:hypothetical protein